MLITLAHFCDKHGPRILLGTQFATDGEELLLPDYPTDTYCDSCSIHFPCYDKSSRSMRSTLHSVEFVSTNYPSLKYQLIYSVIRHMFSEETMTYDGTPLTFYDQGKGLNVAVGFKLQDSDARGDERRYGLLLTIDSPDHAASMELLSRHWDFVNYSFSKIIQYTKQRRDDEVRRKASNESYGDFTPMAGSSVSYTHLDVYKRQV